MILRRRDEPVGVGTGRLLFMLGAVWGAVLVTVIEGLS